MSLVLQLPCGYLVPVSDNSAVIVSDEDFKLHTVLVSDNRYPQEGGVVHGVVHCSMPSRIIKFMYSDMNLSRIAREGF